jgi:ketosteroid isomerase-like protein
MQMDDSAESEIRAIIEERVAAIREKDAARAMRVMAEDVVAFELVPPLALPPGAARDEAGFAAWLASFERISVEVRDLGIEADGRVGFAHSLHHLTGTRVGGVPVDLWLRSTLCFRCEPDGWKIAHAHSSVPFHPGPDMRAAVDLKPA